MSKIEHNGYTIIPFDELPHKDQKYADYIFTAATRTPEAQAAAMTYLREGDILDKQWGAVAYNGNRLAAFAGAKVPIKDESGVRWSEVGTSITMPEHRERGLGTRAAGLVTRQVVEAGVTPVAFTNEGSRSIYTKLGYEPIGEGEIPAEFYEPCEGCPFREWKIGAMCCDTIVKHEGEFDDSILWPDTEPDQAPG